jgi:hypothetical protein
MADDRPAYRASDADRDAVAERLRAAHYEGRLDSDELEERLAATYGAKTMADLDRVTLDLIPPPAPPPPMQAPAPPPNPPFQYAYPPTTNGLAVASLVASIFWFFWIGSIAAIVMGHVALGQIKRSNGWEGGTGLAVAGLVIGYLSFLPFLWWVFAAIN